MTKLFSNILIVSIVCAIASGCTETDKSMNKTDLETDSAKVNAFFEKVYDEYLQRETSFT